MFGRESLPAAENGYAIFATRSLHTVLERCGGYPKTENRPEQAAGSQWQHFTGKAIRINVETA